MPAVKASEIMQQIHKAMSKSKISFRALFDSFDTNKDNMVSLVEFKRGMTDLMQLSGPVIESLFGLID